MPIRSLLPTIVIVLIMVALIWANYSYSDNSLKIKNENLLNEKPSEVRCKDFYRQVDAQRYFDSKGGKAIYPNLDRDQDGKVCESLP
ncbi:MAG TPA: hypothetical protein VG917_03010 [Patescibacteria group bacterium]|nr:hypothetical protein [Patescibacteria group bacterium]